MEEFEQKDVKNKKTRKKSQKKLINKRTNQDLFTSLHSCILGGRAMTPKDKFVRTEFILAYNKLLPNHTRKNAHNIMKKNKLKNIYIASSVHKNFVLHIY